MSSQQQTERLATLLARAVNAHAVVLYEAIAERLGINARDLLAVQLIAREGETTAGRLAEAAGVTTGAVTGLLDRLEQAGIVVREADPDDRRRVVVHLAPGRLDELITVVEPLARAQEQLLARYGAAERAAITDYLGRAAGATEDATAALRASTRGGFVNDTFMAPLAGATRGRLAFITGGPRLSMNVAPFGPSASARVIMETAASRLAFAGACAPDQLLAVHFDGPLPDCRATDGAATIRYRRQPFASRKAELRLNPSIPWTITVSGGITDLGGTIEAPLAALEVAGGANHIKLDLGEPSGTAAIRVTGVVSSAHLRRPSGTPLHLRVDGGISHLRFDDVRSEQVRGERHYEAGDFAGTPDRYDVEILDGAGEIRIEGH